MPSRRRVLALVGAAFGGCLGRDGGTPTDATDRQDGPTPVPPPSNTDTTPEQSTPEGWPPAEWTPDWRHGFDGAHVLGVEPVEDGLFVLADDNDGPATVSLFDPTARSALWRAALDGDVVGDSHLGSTADRANWNVTLAGDAVLVVHGNDDEREWTAVTALDRATGEQRWSLRRDRRLHVRGLADGAVQLLAREFEERTTAEATPGTGPTSTPEPLPGTVLSVDRADGTVRWEREFVGVDPGALSADPDGVYAGVMDDLVAISHDGEERFRTGADARVKRAVVGDGVVYAVARPDWNRSVVTGVGPDGAKRWTGEYAADTAVGVDGSLLLAGDGSWLVEPDGSPTWQRRAYAGWPVFSPDGDTVYFRTARMADAVDSVATADGTGNWRFDPPLNNAWPEAAGADTVVCGGIGDVNGGVGQPLYRVAADSGEATGRFLGDDPLAAAVADDYAFLGTGDYEAGAELLALPLSG